MPEQTYPCPGHEDVCKFCKFKFGRPRSVGGMPEIEFVTKERKVDPCCKACANNLRNESKFFSKTSLS